MIKNNGINLGGTDGFGSSMISTLNDNKQRVIDKDNNISFLINDNGSVLFNDIKFTNLTWCSIGTSITWFNNNVSGFNEGYQTKVQKKIKFSNFTNLGISGGSIISLSTGTTSMNNITYHDVYTIEHGTNDYLNNSPLGTIDDFKNNTGTGTFYGAYRVVIDKIYSLNLFAHIILLTPNKVWTNNTTKWETLNSLNLKLSDYVDAIKNIGEYLSLPVVDMYSNSGINSYTGTYFCTDGSTISLHPNDIGYERMAKLLINEFKVSII